MDRLTVSQRLASRFLSVVCIVAAALLIGGLLYVSNRGLDLSDESYGYLWARNPNDYLFGLRFQGYLLHPIDRLFGHSIVALRVFGVLFSALIGVAVACLALRRPTLQVSFGRLETTAITAIFAAVFAMDNSWWLPTPSYNKVAVWGFLLMVVGYGGYHLAIGAKSAAVFRAALPVGLAIAAGGLLMVLARPPTAMLAFGIAFLLIFPDLLRGGNRRDWAWSVIGSASGWLAVLIAFCAVFLVTPIHLWNLIITALAIRAPLETGSGLLLRSWSDVQLLLSFHTFGISALCLALVGLAEMLDGSARLWLRRLNLALALVALILVLPRLWPLLRAPVAFDPSQTGLVMFAVSAAWVAFAAALASFRDRSLEWLAPSALLLMGPIVVSIATGNRMITQISFCASMYGYAALLAAHAVLPRTGFLLFGLFTVVTAGAVTGVGWAKPFRLATDICSQTVAIRIPGAGDRTLLVDGRMADFATGFQNAADSAGLKPGQPLLDLTGRRPGMNLILGTSAPVYPWVASGYSNSPAILDTVWDGMSSEQRSKAWIVGPIHESFKGAAALETLDPLDTRYELVFAAEEAFSKQRVELWRPRSPNAENGT